MKITVIVPADLRVEVEEFIPRVRSNIEEAQTKEGSAAMEIGKLEAQSAEVSAEIEKLRPDALASSDKAAALTTAEKRLSLIAERIDLLKKQIVDRQQVRMWGLHDLLGQICRHWSAELPGLIAEALTPFYQDKNSAKNAAAMCDCFTFLRHLRYRQSDDPSPIATDRNLQQFEALFSRVSRGHPHLGFDYAESVAATTTPTTEG